MDLNMYKWFIGLCIHVSIWSVLVSYFPSVPNIRFFNYSLLLNPPGIVWPWCLSLHWWTHLLISWSCIISQCHCEWYWMQLCFCCVLVDIKKLWNIRQTTVIHLSALFHLFSDLNGIFVECQQPTVEHKQAQQNVQNMNALVPPGNTL